VPSFRQHVDTVERWREMPALERFDDGSRAVLTFDDGPDEDSTPAVLDALDDAGLKATFFVVGEQLLRAHAIARDAAERGHELALHGFAHPSHDELGGAASRDEIARGVGAFEAATGRSPRFYRPPYGRFNEWSYSACHDLRLEPVYWSAWGNDWEDIAPERIAELLSRDLIPGTIALLHDSARYANRPSAAATAEAVPLIAEYAASREIELVPLGQAVPLRM
jgi:peptidoglycan/xylan/chitin deacetylase (PgdA/CDA1 family)